MQEIDKKDIAKKIINILYLNGEEMDVKEVSNIMGIEKNIVLDNLKEVEMLLTSTGLSFIFNNEKMSISTGSEYFDMLKSFAKNVAISDLTPSQLQTLTIVAYLDSLSISEISFIRGVQSLQTVRALTTRGLLEKDNNKNINTGSNKETNTNIKDKYILSLEALQYMGIKSNTELKDYEIIKSRLTNKMNEALNG